MYLLIISNTKNCLTRAGHAQRGRVHRAHTAAHARVGPPYNNTPSLATQPWIYELSRQVKFLWGLLTRFLACFSIIGGTITAGRWSAGNGKGHRRRG